MSGNDMTRHYKVFWFSFLFISMRPASRADRRLDPRIWLHQPGADRRRGRHYRRPRPGARRAFARPRRGAVHRPGAPHAGAAPRLCARRPAHPVAEPGDLWVLGRHRLLCGDSTVATDVERVLGRVAPHLMVTDPPYGVNYDPAWRNQAGRSINGSTQRIAPGAVIKPIGARAVGKVVNDDRADWREAWALFPGAVAYIWHAGTKAGIVQDSLAACGFETRSQIIWAKNNFAIGRGHYHCKHEPCWYVVRKGSTASWVGDHSQTTLWQIDKNLKSETGHGTQKPVECMRRPIENNASPGQAVYEPFSGSGTTIIAAEMTGRVCHAIEIAPAYVDVTVKRWQEFTGQQAVLDGDGRSFDNVAAQRAR